MVAISRVEVNHDGYEGTALDAMIWDEGSILKPVPPLQVVVDHASLHGLVGFWTALGVVCPPLPSLSRMWHFGPPVSVSSWRILPFWPRCVGPRALLTWVNSVFLTLSYSLCLNSTQAIGWTVKKLCAPTSDHADPW